MPAMEAAADLAVMFCEYALDFLYYSHGDESLHYNNH